MTTTITIPAIITAADSRNRKNWSDALFFQSDSPLINMESIRIPVDHDTIKLPPNAAAGDVIRVSNYQKNLRRSRIFKTWENTYRLEKFNGQEWEFSEHENVRKALKNKA